jgi:alpha-L-rhamnosidase
VEIEVDQEPGDVITLLAGEVMEPDGVTINTATSGGAPGRVQEMIYIAKGGGPERWSPRFSYHGFQFVKISGLRSAPTADTLRAELVFSDLKRSGSFECSEDLVNEQYAITRRTLEANWHSIPEDCPAREKCGWLGDAHATVDISLYGYDVKRFLMKFCRDIEDSLQGGSTVQGALSVMAMAYPPASLPGNAPQIKAAEIDWGSGVCAPVTLASFISTRETASVFERHYDGPQEFHYLL